MKVSLFILFTLGLVLTVNAAAKRGDNRRGGGPGGRRGGGGRGGLKGPFKVCKGHILTPNGRGVFGQKNESSEIFCMWCTELFMKQNREF